MSKVTQKAFPKADIRAAVVASSVNDEMRTFEVVYGTETPVLRGWSERYYEVLSFEPGHVNTTRLDSGRVNLLDSHNTYGARSVMGVVTAHRIEGGKGYATIKFSKRAEMDAYWQDIRDGVICNISVGYSVRKYEHTANENAPDVYRAVDWEPMELSIVSVPADAGAYIRSESGNTEQLIDIISLNQNKLQMNEAQIRAAVAAAGLPGSFADGLIARSGITAEQVQEAIKAEQVRSATPPPAQPVAPPAPAPVQVRTIEPAAQPDVNAAVTAALTAERQRAAEIANMTRNAGLDASFGEGLINTGLTVDAARAAVFAEWENKGTNIRSGNGAAMRGPNEVDHRRDGMADAIITRAGGSLTDNTGKPRSAHAAAGDFRRMSLLEMTRSAVEAMGVNTRDMTNIEIIEAAMNKRSVTGAHSTSDFPIILGNTVNRALRSAYELAPRTFMPFCRMVSVNDFRERTSTQISGMTKGLREVQEGGEYKRDQMSEAQEKWKIKKYGDIVGLTWEAIINDDLSAFSRIPTAMAEDVAQLQSDIVYGILLANAAMSDTVALFHANHGNLGSAAAINIASVAAARAMMRKQTGLDKKRFLNLDMAHMIVGPDKELEAAQLLASVVIPNQIGNVNPYAGKYNLIVEPRVTGTKWFMAANAGRVDTIEYGFLEGEEITLSQKEAFDRDAIEFKVRSTFGAKAIDWRGMFYNPGA